MVTRQNLITTFFPKRLFLQISLFSMALHNVSKPLTNRLKTHFVKTRHIKGTLILFQYLFLMENSILYAKIAVSEKKNFFPKLSFKYYIGLSFS